VKSIFTPGLLTAGLTTFLCLAGCHKAVPVAARPTPPTPVAESAPAPAPKPVAQRPASTPAPNRVAETRRSETMSAAERATLNESLARLEDALFDYDKSTIRSDATTALRDDVGVIRGILSNYPSQKLLIEGHTDERGSSEYNLALGDKRADATQEFLSTMGIPKEQLTVISYGKEHPVCTDQTESCWQKNRRAHITAAR
jgi:peptidoglycan-associated lipoprotein